jgi:hypothetical protein
MSSPVHEDDTSDGTMLRDNNSSLSGDQRNADVIEGPTEAGGENENIDASRKDFSSEPSSTPKRGHQQKITMKPLSKQETQNVEEIMNSIVIDANIDDESDDELSKDRVEYISRRLIDLEVAHSKSNLNRGERDMRNRGIVRLSQHVKYNVLNEVRIARLEERVHILEKNEPSLDPARKDEAGKAERRQEAIPKLNWVHWTDFKASRKRKEPHHAIDVLDGPPTLYHHKQTQSLDLTHANPGRRYMLLPERIRINSRPLLASLQTIAGEYFDYGTKTPIVILRPFKPLFYYEKEIRRYLDQLRAGIDRNTMPPAIRDVCHQILKS